MNKEYFRWLTFNVMLPLMPVFVKIVITVFGDHENLSFVILDSSELIYFNFIICVIFLYDMIQRGNKHRSGIEYWMMVATSCIIFMDIILLVLIYEEKESPLRIKIASCLISILVPIVVSVRKKRDIEEEQQYQSNEKEGGR